MTDLWNVYAIDQNDSVIGDFSAEPDDNTDGYADVDVLLQLRGNYMSSGRLVTFHVYKNHKMYAKCDCVEGGLLITVGQLEKGLLLVQSSDVVNPVVVKICTCGGWSCYGKEADLHSFICDLRR